MTPLLAMTHRDGVRIAEIGLLLIMIGGVWEAAAHVVAMRFAVTRGVLGGLLIGVGALLLIVAVHWARFG